MLLLATTTPTHSPYFRHSQTAKKKQRRVFEYSWPTPWWIGGHETPFCPFASFVLTIFCLFDGYSLILTRRKNFSKRSFAFTRSVRVSCRSSAKSLNGHLTWPDALASSSFRSVTLPSAACVFRRKYFPDSICIAHGHKNRCISSTQLFLFSFSIFPSGSKTGSGLGLITKSIRLASGLSRCR